MKTRVIPTTLQADLARAVVGLCSAVTAVRGLCHLGSFGLFGLFGGALRATLGTSVPTLTKQPEQPEQPEQMGISSSAFGTSWSIENISTCFALNSYEDRMKPGGVSA